MRKTPFANLVTYIDLQYLIGSTKSDQLAQPAILGKNFFFKSIKVVWVSKTSNKYQLIGRCAA